MTTVPFTGTSRTITSENSSTSQNTFLDNLVRRNSTSTQITLEEVIDINQDLVVYTTHQLNLLNPRTLYHTGIFLFNTQLLRINREEEVLVTDQPRHLPLVSQETIKKIIKSRKKLIHLGLVVIGIKGLARKKLGTKLLVMIIDERWSNMKKAMIAAMEVDMSNNKGIFYCNPDYIISVEDLPHIKIGLQSKGYEEFSGRSNILINVGFLGKLTDNSTTKYKLNTERIIDAMSSMGIEMIKPMEIDPKKLKGLEWDLKHMINNKSSIVPGEGAMFKNEDNTYSIRFSNYKERNLEIQEEEENSGKDE